MRTVPAYPVHISPPPRRVGDGGLGGWAGGAGHAIDGIAGSA
jgi:hypothetical protein